MYVPKAFQQTDLAELHRFIEHHSFAVLCSTGEDGVPFASHLLLPRRRSRSESLPSHRTIVALCNWHFAKIVWG